MTETVTVKLGGAMVQYAPKGQPGSTHNIEIPANNTVQSVLDVLLVPAEQPLMIILNDTMVARPEHATTLLNDGDKLALMPPIQAG